MPLFGQLSKEKGTPSATPARVASPEPEDVDPLAVDKTTRVRALQGNECQELVERIMENTLLNVLKEASHGEFKLTQPPVTLRWS